MPIIMTETSGEPIWIAFDNGSIATFDGANFVVMRDALTKDFPYAMVTAMLFDVNQTLWVGFDDAGLGKYDGTEWTFYTSADSELPDDDITGLELDSDGKIWISTNGGGIAILEPQVTSITSMERKLMGIYPNPVESSMTLEFTEILPEAKVTIYDITGREMFSSVINEKNQTIDCSALKQGQYIIKLYDANQGLIETVAFMKK